MWQGDDRGIKSDPKSLIWTTGWIGVLLTRVGRVENEQVWGEKEFYFVHIKSPLFRIRFSGNFTVRYKPSMGHSFIFFVYPFKYPIFSV